MSIRFQSRILVIFTACILLLVFSFLIFFHKSGYEKPIPLYTIGQPTLGNPNAKVHVVVFEDPKCNNCIIFHQENYQKLSKNFINNGLIQYTIYLLGDLSNSNLVARMFLCVNNQSTKAFFTLLDHYYAHPPLALTGDELNEELIRLATITPLNININNLKQCINLKSFENQIIENTNYARAIMGGVIKTPTIFVNGIRLVRPTYKELEKLIQLEMKKGS